MLQKTELNSNWHENLYTSQTSKMTSRSLLKSAAVIVLQSPRSVTLGSQSRRCVSTVLDNKVALVTGSRRGIGLGIAEALAKRGCNVVLNGTTDDELAAQAKTRLSRFLYRILFVKVNSVCYKHKLCYQQKRHKSSALFSFLYRCRWIVKLL